MVRIERPKGYESRIEKVEIWVDNKIKYVTKEKSME